MLNAARLHNRHPGRCTYHLNATPDLGLFDAASFSFVYSTLVLFEPVVPPMINWWKGRPFAPRMEMHCVPRAEVLAILAENGGRLIDTEEELMPGGFQSCRYWVAKK